MVIYIILVQKRKKEFTNPTDTIIGDCSVTWGENTFDRTFGHVFVFVRTSNRGVTSKESWVRIKRTSTCSYFEVSPFYVASPVQGPGRGHVVLERKSNLVSQSLNFVLSSLGPFLLKRNLLIFLLTIPVFFSQRPYGFFLDYWSSKLRPLSIV